MPLIAQNPKNRVILGLMTFAPEGRVTDLEELKKCLEYFQSQGYNEVDTARGYGGGTQEGWTAQAGWKDRGLKLATKVHPRHGHQREKVLAANATSLKDLGTDTVDIYYLHASDRTTPFVETLETINELHKAGKFVEFGLSNFTAYEVAEVVITCQTHGWVRPTVYQAMYNCITRAIEPELVAACRRYGISIVVYNPIAGGLFSGKYKLEEVPAEGRFSAASSQGGNYRKRYFKNAYFDALQLIEPVVKKNDLTLIETALRWVTHHSALKVTPESGGNDGIIIGVSSLAQLENNLKDLEKGPLPQEVLDVLDQAWLVCKAEVPNYWQGELKYTYDTQAALFGKKA